ncbi:hypothetical protein OKW32_006264 [Paraburkholderia youngii]
MTMPKREMQPRAAIADLRAGHDRRAVVEAGGRRRPARALRDVLIDFAVLVRTGTEALHRCDDHARIQFLNPLPREAHPVECARCEVFDQYVAFLDQRFEHLLAFRMLGVDRDRALVVIEHREVQAIHVGNITKLLARDVARACPFHLDHVRAEPCEQLRAGRPRLHMREIEDAHTVECLGHVVSPER